MEAETSTTFRIWKFLKGMYVCSPVVSLCTTHHAARMYRNPLLIEGAKCDQWDGVSATGSGRSSINFTDVSIVTKCKASQISFVMVLLLQAGVPVLRPGYGSFP
jgi:hypothetical protein